jgi:hypothetical protein
MEKICKYPTEIIKIREGGVGGYCKRFPPIKNSDYKSDNCITLSIIRISIFYGIINI